MSEFLEERIREEMKENEEKFESNAKERERLIKEKEKLSKRSKEEDNSAQSKEVRGKEGQHIEKAQEINPEQKENVVLLSDTLHYIVSCL